MPDDILKWILKIYICVSILNLGCDVGKYTFTKIIYKASARLSRVIEQYELNYVLIIAINNPAFFHVSSCIGS
jgi:hypothetical protein